MDLHEGEQLLRRERMHAGVFLTPILAVLAFIALLVPIYVIPQPMIKALLPAEKAMLGILLVWPLGIAVALYVLFTLIAFIRAEVVLTNERVVYRTGRFARTKGELELPDIEGIFLLRPLPGKLLGYGTIGLTVLGGAHLPLLFVRQPHAFLNALKGAAKLAKSRAPGHAAVRAPQHTAR